jgi:hypothetical protein
MVTKNVYGGILAFILFASPGALVLLGLGLWQFSVD